MQNQIETMKKLTYGTELELEGITRRRAAEAVQSVVGGEIAYVGGCYDAWTVTAPDGRVWKMVSDASLSSRANSAEVVTPVLRWEDMDTLQEVVRALRRAGARAERTTSQHIHVGAGEMTVKQIINLVKMEYRQEELIIKSLGTHESRLASYCHRTDAAFIERLERQKPETMRELNEAWYGYYNANPTHYDGSRYHFLNLHALFTKGTIEWRGQNGSVHAGEIKARIFLALAFTAKAINARCASCRTRREYNPTSAKYDFRVELLSLGLIGDEFKNTRMHLLKNLPGCAAWKNGRPVAA
jgi:hypothetical protein